MRSAALAFGTVWLALALIACQPAHAPSAPSAAEVKAMDEHVQAYFKKTVTLPPGVTMKLTDVQPAAAPGLLSANLEVSNGNQTQKVPMVLSSDGRYLIQGQLIDLTADPFAATMSKINLKGEPVRGNPNAPVTIVEYSDFQCPFCGRAYKTLEEQVLKDYGDKVKLVFKNFPLANIHPWAEPAALAAACARQQKPEAFWKLYDFFFQNQQSLNADTLKEKAQEALRAGGFDADAFATCVDTKASLELVKADEAEATALGVRSTPTFFINGRKLEGAVPFDNFKKVIDEALGVPPAAAASTPAAAPPTAVPPTSQTGGPAAPAGGVHPE